MRQSETEVQQISDEKTNAIYSFAFLGRFFLKIVPTKYERDVTIEGITLVNLLLLQQGHLPNGPQSCLERLK
jgi:hypothetical protein